MRGKSAATTHPCMSPQLEKRYSASTSFSGFSERAVRPVDCAARMRACVRAFGRMWMGMGGARKVNELHAAGWRVGVGVALGASLLEHLREKR